MSKGSQSEHEWAELTAVASALPGSSLCRRVQLYRTVDSTMSVAGDLADAGAPDGTLVLADEQTSGRGRRGRAWHAPPGTALMLSLVLRPPADVPPWTVFMAGGVALAQAARVVLGATGLQVELKWPNDLLVGERKAAGLLAERRAGALVLGMGVNVSQQTGDLPEDLRTRVTSLTAAAGRPITRSALLTAWAGQFSTCYGKRPDQESGALYDAYRACLGTLGRQVRVERDQDVPLVGTAVGVRPDGALLVRDTVHAVVPVTVGDVVHLRPAGTGDRVRTASLDP